MDSKSDWLVSLFLSFLIGQSHLETSQLKTQSKYTQRALRARKRLRSVFFFFQVITMLRYAKTSNREITEFFYMVISIFRFQRKNEKSNSPVILPSPSCAMAC